MSDKEFTRKELTQIKKELENILELDSDFITGYSLDKIRVTNSWNRGQVYVTVIFMVTGKEVEILSLPKLTKAIKNKIKSANNFYITNFSGSMLTLTFLVKY